MIGPIGGSGVGGTGGGPLGGCFTCACGTPNASEVNVQYTPGKPNVPHFEGMDVFQGDQHHSSQHPGPERYAGKKIVQANYHFQRLLSGRPSPYFRYLAKEPVRQH